MLDPLRLKLELAGVALAIAALAGVAGWALLERAGRLECRVELQTSIDQVAALVDKLDRQGKAIDALAGQTKTVIDRTGRILDGLEKQGAADRRKISQLEAQLAAKVPTRPDGTAKDCSDSLKEWRAEPE